MVTKFSSSPGATQSRVAFHCVATFRRRKGGALVSRKARKSGGLAAAKSMRGMLLLVLVLVLVLVLSWSGGSGSGGIGL
jgi:hypothetical protein